MAPASNSKPGSVLPQDTRSPAHTELETTVLAIMESVNTHAWSTFRSLLHATPGFRCDWDNFPRSLTLDEMLLLYRQLVASCPDYRHDVKQVSVDIYGDVRNGCLADVYCFGRAVGRPIGVERQSVVRWRWRKCDGKWRCFEMVAFRGGYGMFGVGD